MACIINSSVSVSLHQSCHINKQLEEGHIFYSIVCKKENLVYDDGMLPLIKTDANKLEQLTEEAIKVFNAGIKRAQDFLKGANFYQANHESALTAFMLQQATELTFRTVILSLTGQDVKSHSIIVLKKHCKRCAPALNKIFPGNIENEERIINLMDKAYLNARYCSDFELSDIDKVLLHERVHLLQVRAKEVFEERIGEKQA